jgi:hypothetical protein
MRRVHYHIGKRHNGGIARAALHHYSHRNVSSLSFSMAILPQKPSTGPLARLAPQMHLQVGGKSFLNDEKSSNLTSPE